MDKKLKQDLAQWFQEYKEESLYGKPNVAAYDFTRRPTPCRDKEGNTVYVGDIVLMDGYRYLHGGYAFVAVHNRESDFLVLIGTNISLTDYWAEQFKLVGNIQELPLIQLRLF